MKVMLEDLTVTHNILVPMPHYGKKKTIDIMKFDDLPKFDPDTNCIFNHWIGFISFTQSYDLDEKTTLYCLYKKLLDPDKRYCFSHGLDTPLDIVLYLKQQYGGFPTKDDYKDQYNSLTRRENENVVSFAERAIFIIRSMHYDKPESSRPLQVLFDFRVLLRGFTTHGAWQFKRLMENRYHMITGKFFEISDIVGIIHLYEHPEDLPKIPHDPITTKMTPQEAIDTISFISNFVIYKGRHEIHQ